MGWISPIVWVIYKLIFQANFSNPHPLPGCVPWQFRHRMASRVDAHDEDFFYAPSSFLIDFEVAIQFPAECPDSELVSMGLPLGGSFTEPEYYARPQAPNFASGIAYSPFKLDVWQLAISFSDFKARHFSHIYALLFSCLMPPSHFQSTIPATDEVLVGMTNFDPVHRLDAKEALDRLGTVICSMTLESLLIEPVINIWPHDLTLERISLIVTFIWFNYNIFTLGISLSKSGNLILTKGPMITMTRSHSILGRGRGRDWDYYCCTPGRTYRLRWAKDSECEWQPG